ncbi:MAG TPA: hypothetical protein VHB02_09420 [Acidimicrobiales bacterium]|nr:hypothetical protein [Acidimicrobiales bacterium]
MAAGAAVLASGVGVGAAVASGGASSQYQAPTQAHPVLAAFYFGEADPLNFWNSNLSGAKATFTQMQQEGFNAVELAIPWGEFQPGIKPVRYNAAAFKRLTSLVSLANSLHLQAVLRLSYAGDVYPTPQDPNRFTSVFATATVYNAWLAYITKIHQAVGGFPNVKVAELSWEDFYNPVFAAQPATTPSVRLQLATHTGFRPWLKQRYSLAKVSSMYGTRFTRWSQVPTPPNTQPIFKLMYQYDDWAVVHRFFVPAAARFPGLNLEARVEDDALFTGTNRVGMYSHADTFTLPGTSYIGMYFDPYMGDPSTDRVESVPDALTALRTTLSTMRTRSGGRPLYIFEYEIVSNSPQVATSQGLPETQVPAFLDQSAPIMKKYTLGYSLWTYRDYRQSPIYNSSFGLGTAGWKVTGKVTPSSTSGGSLAMQASSAVSQTFDVGALNGASGSPVTVSLIASSPGNSSTTLQVGISGAPTQAVTVRGGPQTYQVQFPASAFPGGTVGNQVTIATTAPATVTGVQVYDFTQLGDVYNATGGAEAGAAGLVTLNRQLAGG